MARTVLPIVGAVVGSFFGMTQVGWMVGAAIGAAVDPMVNKGPKIGETGAQTSMEGAPRAIVYGTASVTGNVIATGPMIETTNTETQSKGGPVSETAVAYRNYAIRICEGPIAGVLRVWQDDKLVYDIRPGSLLAAASTQWLSNKIIYLGDETQLPDIFLELNVSGIGETPAYRGTAYIIFGLEDLTDRRGSIPQYRFEVATDVDQAAWAGYGWIPVQTTTWTSLPALAVSPDGQVVAVGLGLTGTSWNSSDLETWTTGSIPDGANHIAYGNGLFVAVDNGTNKTVWVGAGSTWTDVPHNTVIDKDGIAFGNGIFVITGHTGGGLRKTITGTGGSWTEHTITPNISGPIRFGNGLFVSLQPNQVSYSADGVAWSQSAAPMPTTYDIEWVDELGLWVLIGVNSTNSVATSPDLITWTQRTTPNLSYFAGAWAPELGIFAIIGDGGQFITSEDLVTWTAQAVLPGGGGQFTDVIWSPTHGKFVGVGASSARIVVSDTTPASAEGLPVVLGDIVADIHDRCKIAATKFDRAELTDLVAGLVLAGDYSGADAINTLRGPYFFDKTEYDRKLWYPKRGAAVVHTLTIDDLVDEPDTARREQALEFPKKLHLFYQHAASGYAAVKATSSRSSPDARVIGEASVQVPVVLNEDQAAQTAHKMHKVAWAEAEGEVQLSVPESFIRLVPSDSIGLFLRGQVKRLRIEKTEHADGVITLTLRHDRQSAYTSVVTGVPIPLPTPPPAAVTNTTTTTFSYLDIGARLDSEDDLHYLVAGTSADAAWSGWTLQRSLDGGATYSTVASYSAPAIMGTLLEAVPSASEHYTDTTNTVRVQLLRDDQTIESITEAQFLSEGGAFVLEKADGTWEVMQYLDADDEGGGIFALTTLHRGRLNSGGSAHLVGAKFVMLSSASHVVAQSAYIGQAVTHRAVSLGQSPELGTVLTTIYVGRSQLEWPVASLSLARDGADVITATWAPRHRFGTDDAPVASVNFTGFRVTIDGTVTFDTTTAGFSYDASALGDPLVVSVSALNRYTGAGPATTGSI